MSTENKINGGFHVRREGNMVDLTDMIKLTEDPVFMNTVLAESRVAITEGENTAGVIRRSVQRFLTSATNEA